MLLLTSFDLTTPPTIHLLTHQVPYKTAKMNREEQNFKNDKDIKQKRPNTRLQGMVKVGFLFFLINNMVKAEVF